MYLGIISLCFLLTGNLPVFSEQSETSKDLQVITVATEHTDGFQRFLNSANKYKLDVKVLGMGKKWEGGDVAQYAGGGHKINLLKQAMEEVKDNKDLIVLFVDSYDLIFAANTDDIVKAFKKLDARVVFSAEGFCWPDQKLADAYPTVKTSEKRFLNSGGFIGYAPEVYDIVTNSEVKHTDDDQLFYTKIFLDKKLREKLSIKLDTKSEIFQNLNGALDDVKVQFKGSNSYLYNMKSGNTPLIIHANGPIKEKFNRLTDYLNDHWTPTTGCQGCTEGTISLKGLEEEDFPQVFMGLFLEQPTPFVEDFFKNIAALKYPKSKIDLFIHYADEFHAKDVERFLNESKAEYKSVKVYKPSNAFNDWTARNKALEECMKADCQYYFAADSIVQFENDMTLQLLIERNRSVIAPMMLRPGKMWSNFWGALSPEGYYLRSDDYIDIIHNTKLGIWNVPYISTTYLVHGWKIPQLQGGFVDADKTDSDMALCRTMRNKGIFMYVDNQEVYGHLVDNEDFDTSHVHNDMYQIFDNRYTWDKKYINPEYYKALAPDFKNEEPCPDVFWFPIVNPVFCTDLVEEVENNGEWSGGGHTPSADKRLQGGYENVPTVDIHTNQIDWERHWLHFLKEYVVPMNTKNFEGYFSEARATMNFVVRYRPNEQDKLRPHADSSTYTINIALNTPGVDYEGGGTRFLRYDCRVTKSRMGWILMHPGRLTHHHEGLPTTKGTRYIMVSFIDP